MAKRQIIKINEEKCTGCGLCIPNCPEGALQIIDGKARLVCDLFCDGLGACIGECPEEAIEVEEREAEPYDERRVMEENIIPKGRETIIAHLKHLREHQQDDLLEQAIQVLEEKEIPVPRFEKIDTAACAGGGCPGSRMVQFIEDMSQSSPETEAGPMKSQLRQWPVQLQLLNPNAAYFKNAHLAITADCVPFAYANFHERFLKGKTLIILCPKLDQTREMYIDKLAQIFENQDIQSVSIVHMEVPCCYGIERIVDQAMKKSGRNILIKDYTTSIQGEII